MWYAFPHKVWAIDYKYIYLADLQIIKIPDNLALDSKLWLEYNFVSLTLSEKSPYNLIHDTIKFQFQLIKIPAHSRNPP